MSEQINIWYENQCVSENEKSLSIFSQIEQYQSFKSYFDREWSNQLQEKQKSEREHLKMCLINDKESVTCTIKEQWGEILEKPQEEVKEKRSIGEIMDPVYYAKKWWDAFWEWEFEIAINFFEKQWEKDIKNYWPENINVIGWYVNIWVANYKLWKYEKAFDLYVKALNLAEDKYPDNDIINLIYKNIKNLLLEDSFDTNILDIDVYEEILSKIIFREKIKLLKKQDEERERSPEWNETIEKMDKLVLEMDKLWVRLDSNIEKSIRDKKVWAEDLRNNLKEQVELQAQLEKQERIQTLKEQIVKIWEKQPELKVVLNGMMELLEESLETKVDKGSQELVDKRQNSQIIENKNDIGENNVSINMYKKLLNQDLKLELNEIRENEKLNQYYSVLFSHLGALYNWVITLKSEKLEAKKSIFTKIVDSIPIIWDWLKHTSKFIDKILSEREMNTFISSIYNINNFETTIERLTILITQENKSLILQNNKVNINKLAVKRALIIIHILQQEWTPEKLRNKHTDEAIQILRKIP